ncbi:MAG: hypothetical protein ACEPOZ_21590 [Marinifilaceae bacterium]
MAKKNVIISYKNLDHQLIDEIENLYPNGIEHLVKKYPMGPGKSFYAFPYETTTTNYLIKVDVILDVTFNMSLEREPESEVVY